ncbi:RHS repeat domain-containing protein [Streptomyces sp. NBC_01766]|uniref:RHS repeat domain-containing protein n=1 Tax=Streptomyces sp. NBC_01766 TaxID=2975936 RepID=UPI002DDA2DAC|nr:RHS repeat-associated core domain-containing protein [Streptomyces sp. NBC_01766]WSC19030.1 RHS repeat protein [Streptomyces sp. NBC_01766]
MAGTLAGLLGAGLIGGPVAAATGLDLMESTKPKPVPTAQARTHQLGLKDETQGHAWKTPKVSWPKAGVATVRLPEADRSRAKAGTLPVEMRRSGSTGSAPTKATVQVLDRKATEQLGVDGLLLAVRPEAGAPGKVDVRVDYAGVRGAYGGDWASRLTLRRLPACALTGATKGCGTGEDLPGVVNDTEAGTLTATVPLDGAATAGQAPVTEAPRSARSATGLSATSGTVLLAATASASGPAGDFGATSLAPSSTWSAGGSNGGFSWNYALDTPDVPGGTQPDLALSYSSQSVDGRTAATNNQANWIGDGWSMEPGYIERRYISCADDVKDGNGTAKSGDLCWKSDNAILNLGGQSNVLIKDDKTGDWHLESDDGTKVDKLTSSNRGNGDNDGEYWRVTTPDGTRYYFGYNRLPNWVEGDPETNSTWTVPVYGNQKGEPCQADAYKDSWCKQAWRWNLDYVVDPHSDAMAYYWNKESNSYGRDVNPDTGASTATPYDRGGWLDHIDYGLRSNAMYTKKAAAKVTFTTSERCLSDCATFDKTHAKNWPDVPFDQYCKEGEQCKDRYSPSFWTRKRLTKIDTSVLVGSAYKPVDSWALAQQFPSTGDGSSPALWLDSITRTGHTGTGDVSLPAVTFLGQQLANRVEGATTGGRPDPVPPLVRYRVRAVNTESGSTLGVTYSAPDCKPGSIPKPESNTRRCYPVMWSPPDAPAAEYEPYLDWFHSYVVDQILESDNTGGAPVKETDYTYLDGLAWAKEQGDEFTKAKYLTYGDRKGYGRVQVRTGAPAEGKQTLTEYRYFRGIEGAKVTDHEGKTVTDHPAFAGMTREEATYNGDGGTLESTLSHTPWHSPATATHTRTGLPTQYAYATGDASETNRTSLGGDKWRTTRTDRTFDGNGQILTESNLGDTAGSGDEECTTTSYAKNADKNILTLVKEIRTTAVACDATASLPADLVSVERHYYDDATGLDTAPVKGDVTRLDEQDDKGTGYLITATHTYDQHGRELTDTDADAKTTRTAYTPATVAAPTSSTVTNALGHAATTTYDPARGLATAVVDPNGKRSDAEYDGLGRTVRAWTPSWPKSAHADQPATAYTYTVSRTAANAVATKSLQYDGSYASTYELLDGMLRPRETQAPALGTKDRLVTETLYDTRGNAWKTYDSYYAEGAPSTVLTSAPDNKIPSMTENVYDGMSRVTAAVARTYGDETWRTRTEYAGDRTTVIPPAGGTATTTVTDALGRTSELLEYTDAARTASQKTAYTYGKYGEPVKVTDPSGNTWTWTLDARGQQVRADDPDKGVTTTTYDKLGRAATVTDARGTTLTTTYDELGRETAVKKGSTTLTAHTYDTVAKGQPATSTRYVDGAEYTSAVTAYNDAYEPTASSVTIPSGAGSVAGTYDWTFGYNKYTGQQEWLKQPAVGNLPGERVTTVYGPGNLPLKSTAGAVILVGNSVYDVWSRPTRTEYGALGKKVYRSRAYDLQTGRLTRQTTDRDLAPQRIDDSTWSYDDAGNITGLTTASGQDAARTVDTQCFTQDALGRLTEAWTATKDCTAKPSAAGVGGPSAYWQSFTYDALGNRTKQTDHGTGVLAGADSTTTYTQPAAGKPLPHAVQTAAVKGGADDGKKSTFGYDKAGNTTDRTLADRQQKLAWDDEGHLKSLTENGKSTDYLYDADGDRLLTHEADGSTTLNLPGNNQLTVTAAGVKDATRYYSHGDETVAVRTSKGFSYLINDHQGTATAAIAAGTLAITRRKQLPFGQLRSEESETLPGTRGFVGGTNDPTGLTHLGAREYDPTLGRFLSVDPVIDTDEPAQMNAYSYAHNNPITQSDPTGLRPLGPTDGGQSSDDRWAAERGMNAGYTYKNGKWVWNQTPKKDKASQKKYAAYRANPAHYMIDDGNAKAQQRKYAAESRKAEAARQKAQAIKRENQRKAAQAAQRKKDGIFGSIMKGNWGAAWTNAKNTGAAQWVGNHWDDIKNYSAIVGFGVCIVASAGTCIAVGAGIAAAKFLGDGIGTGNWDVAALSKDLAWTAVGGGSAAVYGRLAGGARSWGAAYRGNAIARLPRAYRTKVPGTRGVGGGSRSWTSTDSPGGAIDWGTTYGNMSVNAISNTVFCGSGNASAGSYGGVC